MLGRISTRLFETDRGIGFTDLFQGLGESPLVVLLFAVLTQLGDVWFLFLLGGVLYVAGEYVPRWGIDRRQGLFVLALAITYVALIEVLKNIFVLPRPPGAGEPPALGWIPSTFTGMVTNITTADGPGFPSGHALGTTMVWGGLALVLDRASSRVRFGVTGVVVVLVSFSRLALGVHYFVDVLVGATLGVITLGVLYWVAEYGTNPGRVLFVAVVFGVLGLFSGVTFDSVAATGGAVGGWMMWRRVADATPAHPTNDRAVITGFVALGITGGFFAVVYTLEPPTLLTFFGTAIAAGTVVGAPLLGERLS